MSSRPKNFPLRLSFDDAKRIINERRGQGYSLLGYTHRTDIPEPTFEELCASFEAWEMATTTDLKRIFWGGEVADWFLETSTRPLADYDDFDKSYMERHKMLDAILQEITEHPEPAYLYDVCFSFAGEQREYVEQVAELLLERGVRVFYDRHEVVNLWGKDLYDYLNQIYRDAARYCVIFISKEYAGKNWPSHERKSAQARAFREMSEYILPARFDDTKLPGLDSTVGYIDLRTITVDQLASIIQQKLGVS